MFEYLEQEFNFETRKLYTVTKWTVTPIANHAIRIQKETPEGKNGEKTVKVENDPEYAYKLMKTKIKADLSSNQKLCLLRLNSWSAKKDIQAATTG